MQNHSKIFNYIFLLNRNESYSGFFDLLEKKGMVTKEGNRYSYIDLTGTIHKYFRKEWNKNTNSIFDLVMSEFEEKNKALSRFLTEEESPE